MLKLKLDVKKDQRLKILCLGAHSDDIEIGCGGTVLWLLSQYDKVEVNWVVFSSGGKRYKEATSSAKKFLSDAEARTIMVKDFKNSFFPFVGDEIKTFFESMKNIGSPDVVFTHYRHDLHQDHRLVSDLTWNTFRDHLILEYEILKYDGDLGVPNLYVPLDDAICRKKIELILASFKTQRDKDWFTADAFYSLLRVRGVESRAAHKYAEGFYCRKAVV